MHSVRHFPRNSRQVGEYADKTWKDYQEDKKLQKLIDRTVENILTALIEVSGTILTEEGIGVDSYSDALRKVAKLLGFSEEEQDSLVRLAFQRNRLAHRYLNFRWEAIRMFKDRRDIILELMSKGTGKGGEKRRKDKLMTNTHYIDRLSS